MRQVCGQLGLLSGQSEEGKRPILKKENVMNPLGRQLKEAGNKEIMQ